MKTTQVKSSKPVVAVCAVRTGSGKSQTTRRVARILRDMDFKVAGTKNGITALQMDIKVKGITTDIMAQALNQARQARLHILEKMLEVIPSPLPELKPHAPRILTVKNPVDKMEL